MKMNIKQNSRRHARIIPQGFLHKVGILSALLTILLCICSRKIPNFGEFYAVYVYPLFVRVVGGIFSWIPVSVAEIAMFAGFLLLIFSLILLLYRILSLFFTSKKNLISKIERKEVSICEIDKGEIKNQVSGMDVSEINGRSIWLEILHLLTGYLAGVLSLASILLLIFMLGGGINYYRIPFSAREGLLTSGITREELEEFCRQMVEEVNREVDTMGDMESARIYAEWQGQARQSICYLGQEFPSLAGFYPNPKPVTLSRFLTLQQVTGIYSPFTIEANYNQEVPDYECPFTICHELSHLKGFMREDEANFIAWLACYKSEDAYFRYSAALEGFCYAGNALFKYDREKYRELRRNLCTEAEQDLQYGYQFWHQFDGPVADVHEKINDAYLKANNQKDGVESYGRVVNLMVGYMREH